MGDETDKLDHQSANFYLSVMELAVDHSIIFRGVKGIDWWMGKAFSLFQFTPLLGYDKK